MVVALKANIGKQQPAGGGIALTRWWGRDLDIFDGVGTMRAFCLDRSGDGPRTEPNPDEEDV